MGGEKLSALSSPMLRLGSPPRGRGKATFWSLKNSFHRITPAWAGKRRRNQIHKLHTQDHPRVGGEKFYVDEVLPGDTGSPPRGRGKVAQYLSSKVLGRITPAWAGKRLQFFGLSAARGDHPRVGGEKALLFRLFPAYWGSPPRGRGKVIEAQNLSTQKRITPAWAGKSHLHPVRIGGTQDHPRVGGEKCPVFHRYLRGSGSPPRGRGKAYRAAGHCTRLGITPAWAGKRLKRSHRSGIFISGPIPFHSVLHRPAGSGSSRAGRDGSPAGQPQNAGPA